MRQSRPMFRSAARRLVAPLSSIGMMVVDTAVRGQISSLDRVTARSLLLAAAMQLPLLRKVMQATESTP